ncbi:PPC domain-containing protein [Frigoriglobus tundricola]|uniref:Peptidase C-terminal archaeal/bacterial domain-containing protein n=1 Tax=Frigoriglobus tundricola TaxID=2774151 RepID=A0A6M5YR06_9BACT|nr:PPC domain-containing protein [Frigoriglobus tundricola]QJW96378.1 hypothetical protein FTUN_3935 [Frigoriglobus tundricola]
MLARRTFAALALLLMAGSAAAQTGPQLLTVFPPGAKAGETVEVTFSGAGFDGDEKLLFSAKGFTAERIGAATIEPKGPKGQPSASVKFKVTPAKTSTGAFDVRVVSKSGLSNPRAFVVSNTTEVNETEPNNDVGQAQKIDLETTVSGVISAPTDVDYVTFKVRAKQRVVVACLTTSIDSKMQADLMAIGPDGKQLASNRGYRGGDAVLDFTAPKDGDYLVRVSQFAYTTGGSDHFYRLTVTTEPWIDAFYPPLARSGFPILPAGRGALDVDFVVKSRARAYSLESSRLIPPTAAMIDAVDFSYTMPGGNVLLDTRASPAVLDNGKNNTADAAQAVDVPADIAGRIAKKNDRHWYRFVAKKGEVWTLEVFAERIGSPVDAYFVLADDRGKVMTEQDDGPDTLSPNQFYTKGNDPARYRFAAPADGTYKVMVSTREAGTQFGVRDQYVLRIAKEHPDFRLAVMPLTPHLPDAGTLARGGATVFAVFVFRFDGFDGPIELSAPDLPKGVTCPPQVIGPGQTRGTLVLVADQSAKDWEGFVQVLAKGFTKVPTVHEARPFTVTWPVAGLQANQPPPNVPMITRMDRGEGLALAVRGDAPFALTPTVRELVAKPGGKIDVTLVVSRKDTFKDPIQVFSATPGIGPRQQGNQAAAPIGTAQPGGTELNFGLDVPGTLPPGTHTLVLRGQSAAPVPKGGNNTALRPVPTYAALPISITVEGGPKKK